MNAFTTPARPVSDAMMSQEGQQNAGGQRRQYPDSINAYYDSAPLTDYPRMMYRKTSTEQFQQSADVLGLKDEKTVINRFDGLLCDMTIAHDANEAEALSSDGWDVSPKAAHGIVDGLAKATSAKDDEIAALRAQLAAQAGEPEKRGPGRPPKVAADA